MSGQNVSVLILAAGKGTRMKSARAKVLHEISFKPMLHHVLDAVQPLCLSKIVVVTGHQAAEVEASCTGYPVEFARQTEQLGTGHAVLAAADDLVGHSGSVFILCGDTPLITRETLDGMLSSHLREDRLLTVMTTVVDDPTNYGRIISNEQGDVEAIVEEKDASPGQREICEINAGIYCVNTDFLFNALKEVGTDNKQGEVYLTDIVSIAHNGGRPVHKFVCTDSREVLGVNSRLELARAHAILQQRMSESFMAEGVTFYRPETTSIDPRVTIGRDTIVHANVALGGSTAIGENCSVGSFSSLVDCRVGDNVIIGSGAHLQGAVIEDNGEVTAKGK